MPPFGRTRPSVRSGGRPFRQLAWTTLNSNFALWFLSSIVVGGAAFGFSSYQRAGDLAAKRAARSGMILIELSDRTFRVKSQVVIADIRGGAQLQQKYVTALAESGFVGSPSPDRGGFPELADRSVSSLVWELASLDPKIKQKAIELTASLQILRFMADGDPGMASTTRRHIARILDDTASLRSPEFKREYDNALSHQFKEVLDTARESDK